VAKGQPLFAEYRCLEISKGGGIKDGTQKTTQLPEKAAVGKYQEAVWRNIISTFRPDRSR
jgi:hypothetical protein